MVYIISSLAVTAFRAAGISPFVSLREWEIGRLSQGFVVCRSLMRWTLKEDEHYKVMSIRR
jgi:hypothetical protein